MKFIFVALGFLSLAAAAPSVEIPRQEAPYCTVDGFCSPCVRDGTYYQPCKNGKRKGIACADGTGLGFTVNC
ncbi:hypothetical protein HJFPF1_04411 [Paramyrothecium foliicola]|nr:hypothetical protein HJFPF1_04411 [Paramyrothecium foliicola]